MSAITKEAMGQIFTEARSFSAWLPKDVSEDLVPGSRIFSAVWATATGANSIPARRVLHSMKHAGLYKKFRGHTA